MSANIFGKVFRSMSFGESHGPGLGVIIDGCPAGVTIDESLLRTWLARRRPGQNALVSPRQESDQAEILSGVFQGKTLGTPIAMLIRNHDARPEDYTALQIERRRGHATDLWQEKFSHSDPRGSGRASGRETVSRVLAGAVAQMLVHQLCPEVRVFGYVEQIGSVCLSPNEYDDFVRTHANCPATMFPADQYLLRLPSEQKSFQTQQLLESAQAQNDSYGGVAAVSILCLPRGLGQPVYHKLKADLAAALMSVGATCGFELGMGFSSAQQSGQVFHSENQTYGGERGGLSTGEPLQVRIAFKPTSSVGEVARKGRHDPCIVPRAVVVLEAMAWLVLADHFLWRRLDKI